MYYFCVPTARPGRKSRAAAKDEEDDSFATCNDNEDSAENEETLTAAGDKEDTEADMEEGKAKASNEDDGEKPSEDNSPTFADKLMELLQNDVDSDAIWWLPDNESFGINKQIFEDRSEFYFVCVSVCGHVSHLSVSEQADADMNDMKGFHTSGRVGKPGCV